MEAAREKTLLELLSTRFALYPDRHRGIVWEEVAVHLEASPAALAALQAMEDSGGEPDVIGREDGRIVFCDCAAESPAGRRSLCFDRAALESRREHKPKGSALEMAASMGVELLDEAQYRALQELGEFDRKTSSWVRTPDDIRKLGGALFCDRRYGHVFVYHNGAESYYAVRGFRARLVV
jgi:hypothetical protein